MSEEESMVDVILGFFLLRETPDRDGYLGALLITNIQGIPQEFRCTRPVKPTTIQKPLYGAALEPYIGIQLCGTPLLESSQHSPSILFVNSEDMLDLRGKGDTAVAYVREAGSTVDLEPVDPDSSPATTARFKSKEWQPITYNWHEDYPDDEESIREILTECSKYLNPVEPFERITTAISVLQEKDKGFR